MGRTVAAADSHLGAHNADVAAFNAFLDEVHTAEDIDRFVLLGDIFDMVRRDPRAVVNEHSDTVTRIKTLSEQTPVHYIPGNHDARIAEYLECEGNDINYREDMTLESGDDTIYFCHGNEFDHFQFDRLSAYLHSLGDIGDIDPTRGQKDKVTASMRNTVNRGKDRITAALTGNKQPVSYSRRERTGHDYLEHCEADKLVYGHTHTPYVHPDNTAANTGSWKTTAPNHNTYLEIDDGDLTLYRFRMDDEDEELEKRR